MMVTGLLAAAVLLPAPAHAQQDAQRQEGATIRLVALPPDAGGTLHGALSIELEPGWKTYWIAPGPVGLAPQIDFSGSIGLSEPVVAFPVPERFAEGDAESVGYAEPVAFPISAEAARDVAPVLRASVFLGLCRELCVPVQATLAAAPTGSLSDRALVRRAQGSVPTDESAPAPTLHWNADRSALLVDAGTAGPSPADIFVSAGPGWSFGRPISPPDAPDSALSVPVLTRPSTEAGLQTVDIVLTRADSAQLFRAVTIEHR